MKHEQVPIFVIMCDCAEEQERKARERERLRRERIAQEEQEEAERREPPPRFNVYQIALGTTTCMLALLALLFKVVDNNTTHAILSKVGLGHLVPKRDEMSNGSGYGPGGYGPGGYGPGGYGPGGNGPGGYGPGGNGPGGYGPGGYGPGGYGPGGPGSERCDGLRINPAKRRWPLEDKPKEKE